MSIDRHKMPTHAEYHEVITDRVMDALAEVIVFGEVDLEIKPV